MTYKMPIELIELFHCVVPEEAGESRSFAALNLAACRCGFAVMPDACVDLVMEWLETKQTNPNATFYREWQDVKSRNYEQLVVDQLIHYMSTYGTDFSLGNGYVPNKSGDSPVMTYGSLVPIASVTADEMKRRCIDMLSSGIALDSKDVNVLAEYIGAHGGCDVDSLKNREAKYIVHRSAGSHPSDPAEYVKYLVYLATGNTMMVNNAAFRHGLYSAVNVNIERLGEEFSRLGDDEIDMLATVYFRFKKVILCMRRVLGWNPSYDNARRIINRIANRARKLKVPFKPGAWQTLLTRDHVPADEAKSAIDRASMFSKAGLLLAADTRISRGKDAGGTMYRVRNGKVFYRSGYVPNTDDTDWLVKVCDMLLTSIVSTLAAKRKTGLVKADPRISVAMPTSGKNFLGNYPTGTIVSLGRHVLASVYWRNEWGTRDFDLSMIDSDGATISWNTALRDMEGAMMHSGDMTNADPEASECIYMDTEHKSVAGAMLMLYQYSGENPNGKFRFIVGTHGGPAKLDRGYMIDPKDIVLSIDSNISNTMTNLAAISAGQLMLVGHSGGFGHRALIPGNESISIIAEEVARMRSIRSIRSLLESAGYEFVGPEYEGEVDLDLTVPDKDTLIKFFSED